MPVTTKLSREVAEPIFDGYLEKPCIKCGQDHPAINHKGPGMSGSVWRTLTGDELNLAEKYLIDLRNDYAKEQKKRRAKKLAAGNSDQQQPALVTSPIVPPVCIAPATSAHAGGSDPYATTATADLKDIYGQDLEEEVQIELPEKNGAPGKTNVSPGELFSSTRLPNPTTGSQYPLRTSFATPTSEVLTNHFEITWKENTQFYVYEILEIPASKSKRQLKTIVKAAIEAWDFLRDNKDFFTTDYIKTIVAWKNLHGSINCPRKDVLNETQWTPEPLADGERRMNLAFKYHGTLNLDRLKQFIHPSSLADDSADTTLPNFNFDPLITHLNNVISKSLSDDVFQTSAHRFYFKNGYDKLGQSNTLCVMRGYEYTVKSAMEKVLLNVNAATSAFFLPITVAEFMKDGSTFAKNELEKRIKGLKVYIVPQRQDVNDVEEQKRVENLNKAQNRIKTIKSFGKPIGTRTEKNFKFHKWVKNADGQSVEDPNETHVIEHMQAVFGRQHFINEELKAVNVGSDDDPIWYPQEFLRILPNQMYNNLLPDRLVESMLKLACKEPAEIRARIESEGLLGLGIDRLNEKQAFKKCDVLEISPNMLQVPSKRMPAVHIIYTSENKQANMDDKAQWNLRGGVKFLESPASTQTLNYYMVVGPDLQNPGDTSEMYQASINRQIKDNGIGSGASCLAMATLPPYDKNDPTEPTGKQKYKQCPKTHEELKQDIEHAIKFCKQQHSGGQLVVLLLRARSIAPYSAFKDVVDRTAGLHSFCITEDKNYGKSTDDSGLSLYTANVMMKVNLKLQGRNHTSADGAKGEGRISVTLSVKAPSRSTMILGADVTHPGGGSLIGCPSIATLVGSTDTDGGRFLGSMRTQSVSKKEVIDTPAMYAMAMERFKAWCEVKGSVRPNIIYYRDGVSTGQYADVLSDEVAAIKRAWTDLFRKDSDSGKTDEVKVTAIIGVKRHHTRFFPLDKDAHKNGNCKAGTLVDQGIVSPFFTEFFLQSHHALHGTAIPTRYFVLENGLRFSDTDIQNFTHKLCFTYVRATMGVSYAPPAYYADRLCERGRQYLRDWFTPNYDSEHYKAYQAQKDRIEAAEKAELTKRIAKLPVQPIPEGRRRARKTQEQVDMERASRKTAEKLVEEHILKEANEYLWGKVEQDGKGKGPEKEVRCGPWHESLDGTMFWM